MSPSAPDTDPSLTIVVPAFNEATRLGVGLDRLRAAVEVGAVDLADTEVVLVDDGSSDGTAERARELLSGYPRSTVLRFDRNFGKGAAVRAGVAAARGAAIAFMDADMAIDPDQIPLLMAGLEQAELAIGSRSLADSSADGDSMGRNLMGRTFNWVVNATTGLSLGDTQCGFKGFRAPVARLLFHVAAIDRYAFDVEVLHAARRLGLTIAEVPVHWVNVRGSRIRPLRDGATMVSDLAGRRIGLRRPRPVDAVAVSPEAGGAAAARRLVARSTPVVRRPDGGALVLFPLASADQVANAAKQLRSHFGEAFTSRLTLTVSQLVAISPLSIEAGEGSSRPPIPYLKSVAPTPPPSHWAAPAVAEPGPLDAGTLGV